MCLYWGQTPSSTQNQQTSFYYFYQVCFINYVQYGIKFFPKIISVISGWGQGSGLSYELSKKMYKVGKKFDIDFFLRATFLSRGMCLPL